jgi:hypothetical protein
MENDFLYDPKETNKVISKAYVSDVPSVFLVFLEPKDTAATRHLQTSTATNTGIITCSKHKPTRITVPFLCRYRHIFLIFSPEGRNSKFNKNYWYPHITVHWFKSPKTLIFLLTATRTSSSDVDSEVGSTV